MVCRIYSQTKSGKIKEKIVVNSLSSGNYSQVVTVPQVILNDLLRKWELNLKMNITVNIIL